MKTKKFKRIKKNYKKEQKRWNNLKVGQFIYIEFPRFIEMEYFLCIIEHINVDEREVKVLDLSIQSGDSMGKRRVISSFSTIEELKDKGIVVYPPNEEELNKSKMVIEDNIKLIK